MAEANMSITIPKSLASISTTFAAPFTRCLIYSSKPVTHSFPFSPLFNDHLSSSTLSHYRHPSFTFAGTSSVHLLDILGVRYISTRASSTFHWRVLFQGHVDIYSRSSVKPLLMIKSRPRMAFSDLMNSNSFTTLNLAYVTAVTNSL
jgi:hypothetical protein